VHAAHSPSRQHACGIADKCTLNATLGFVTLTQRQAAMVNANGAESLLSPCSFRFCAGEPWLLQASVLTCWEAKGHDKLQKAVFGRF